MRSTLRVAAILLALLTGAQLVQLGRAAEPHPPAILLVARALTIGVVFHAGLFLVPRAVRPWHRLTIATLMLPSALIVVGLLGQIVARFARGAALFNLSSAIGVLGVAAYALGYWELARRPWRDA